MNELGAAVRLRGLESAPDFLTIDGGEGGSGAAPQALADHMALSINEALPRVIDALIEHGLRGRVKVIASGKLLTPAKVAWALAREFPKYFAALAEGRMLSIRDAANHPSSCELAVAYLQLANVGALLDIPVRRGRSQGLAS